MDTMSPTVVFVALVTNESHAKLNSNDQENAFLLVILPLEKTVVVYTGFRSIMASF